MKPPEILSRWQHYKGTVYTVLKITVDSETLQLRVVYVDATKLDGPEWDRVLSGRNPETGKPCGWFDPLPDGTPRYRKID